METVFFKSIDELKTVVKINASLPWEAIYPYIIDARDIYLAQYLGEDFVDSLEAGEATSLLPLIRRALGPLTVMLAAPEMGISIGDAGITVANDQGKRSPANEAKIAAAVESFRFRGFQAMDRLLTYLEDHKTDYPEWASSRFCTIRSGSFINSARTFQDVGLVNIDYSIITFNLMFQTIRQIEERAVREVLSDELFMSLLAASDLTPKKRVLIDLVIRFLANKTAELYTSQTSREQRTQAGRPEFKPIIRPLYNDQEHTGNFFGDQANYYLGKISNFVIENSEELCVTLPSSKLDWNSKDKKIVALIS